MTTAHAISTTIHNVYLVDPLRGRSKPTPLDNSWPNMDMEQFARTTWFGSFSTIIHLVRSRASKKGTGEPSKVPSAWIPTNLTVLVRVYVLVDKECGVGL